MSQKFREYLIAQGIHHEVTAANCPQQNGVAERMNRTLCESARAMLFHAGMSAGFWAEAINTAAYVHNRLPTATHKETPFERWHGRKPDLSKLRVFGCTAYSYVHNRQKLDKKCEKLIFVGYSIKSKAYRVYDAATNTVKERRDVKFDEERFTTSVRPLSDNRCSLELSTPATVTEGTAQQPENRQHRSSQRAHAPPVRYGIDEYAQHVAYHMADIVEPETF